MDTLKVAFLPHPTIANCCMLETVLEEIRVQAGAKKCYKNWPGERIGDRFENYLSIVLEAPTISLDQIVTQWGNKASTSWPLVVLERTPPELPPVAETPVELVCEDEPHEYW